MAPTSPVSGKLDQQIIFEARARLSAQIMNEGQREEAQRLLDLAELGHYVKQSFHTIVDGLNCVAERDGDEVGRPTLLGLNEFKEKLDI